MSTHTPPSEIRTRILHALNQEERQQSRRYILVSGSTLIGSAALAAVSVLSITTQLPQTSFFRYLSLIVSDPDVVTASLRDFGLSLIESMPLFGITASLLTTTLVLVSIRMFVKNIDRAWTFVAAKPNIISA